MVLRLISAVLLVFAFSGPAYAKTCSQQEAMAAEMIASTLTSWRAVHDFYQRYRQCDDGAIAEGLTESVMKLLAREWPSTSLFRMASAEPSFKAFVLLHINASGAEHDLEAVELNSSKRCPVSQRGLCKDIMEAVKVARSELYSNPNMQHRIEGQQNPAPAQRP